MREHRNPLLVIVFSFVTFGIYYIYWTFKTTDDIESLGEDLPNPLLIIVPFANIYFLYEVTKGFCSVTGNKDNFTLFFIANLFTPLLVAGVMQSQLNKTYDSPDTIFEKNENAVQGAETADNEEQSEIEQVANKVDEMLSAGYSQDEITQQLRSAGIPDNTINQAYLLENKRNGYD